MGLVRAPFQGVRNILCFNWRQYGVAGLAMVSLGLAACIFREPWKLWCILVLLIIAIPSLVSLLVSYHIYDYSRLYEFSWLDQLEVHDQETIVNITAGFDETSAALRSRYPRAAFRVLDFYDVNHHTELSLLTARRLYAPAPGTEAVTTVNLSLETGSADKIFVIFSAHEIRDNAERTAFFIELNRILKSDGYLIVIEHLRDFANILAYTIGSLHFHSRATWRRAFDESAFRIIQEISRTSFVTIFILKKHEPLSKS